MNGQADTTKLLALLTPHKNGTCPVVVDYDNGAARCQLPLPEEWRITPREELLQGLRDWLNTGWDVSSPAALTVELRDLRSRLRAVPSSAYGSSNISDRPLLTNG